MLLKIPCLTEWYMLEICRAWLKKGGDERIRFQTNKRPVPTTRLFTRNHRGILNSLHLVLGWNRSFGERFVWFGVLTWSLISWKLAVVSVTGCVRRVFAEGCCLGCQEAVCECLHHLRTKAKQCFLRDMQGNSAQGRPDLVSCPRGAKTAKRHL